MKRERKKKSPKTIIATQEFLLGFGTAGDKVLLLELCLVATVLSATKLSTSVTVRLSRKFAPLIAAEKTDTLSKGLCPSADIRNTFKSVGSKTQTSADSLPPDGSKLVGQWELSGGYLHIWGTPGKRR